MAIEDGDMQKRWDKREQMRQQQQKQKKRTIIGLIVAAVVLVAVAVLILVMNKDSIRDNKPAKTTPAPATKPSQAQNSVAGPDTTVIHLAAAGDLNVTDKVIASGDVIQNYTAAFMDVVPLLANADVAVMNFEGNLAGDPLGTESRSAPTSMADALRNAGVDFIQVANSWSLKNGMRGLDETLTNFRLAGIEPLGAYSTNSEAEKGGGYTICTVQGVKIAFVAFTKGMDSGMSLPEGREKCVNVLYKDYDSTYRDVDTEGIQAVLERVKDEKPDVVVAMVHWGSEYNDTISKSQKKIRDLMLENGVDAIIGTHAHYVQAMEYDGNTGQFVAYSLGDFFGDAQRSGTAYSVILDLEITKNNRSGETKITGFSYTPIYTTAASNGLLRVMRLEPAIKAYEEKYLDRVSEGVYEDMKYAMTRIEQRIHAKVED